MEILENGGKWWILVEIELSINNCCHEILKCNYLDRSYFKFYAPSFVVR